MGIDHATLDKPTASQEEALQSLVSYLKLDAGLCFKPTLCYKWI
jgi:hypothetical protein